jgi:signal transduction histidine kinase
VTDDVGAGLAAIARIDAVPTILEVVCRAAGMGFAAVARVTEDRWVACAVRDEIGFGLGPGGELEIGTTLCSEVRAGGRLVVIDHVAEDEAFRGHPTPAMYGFQSYISVPIRRADGVFFGTLCALDLRPRRLSAPETVGMFRLFADLIGLHLDARERLEASEAALREERRRAELREQFVAVLGHDLRGPLAAIVAGAWSLGREPLGEEAGAIVADIQGSADRMARLIGDVLDFARGRLGGGLELRRASTDLGPALGQVVAELRAAWPGRAIEAEIALPRPVDCDRDRVARLLANLVANALEHGTAEGPVRVRASAEGGALELSVANPGGPIPPATLGRLFEPFARASDRPGRQGLGLGLYIAAEIARAHGGTLDVASTPAETRFTFRMPLRRRGGRKRAGAAPLAIP